MRSHTRFLLAALLSMLTLASATGTAAARRFELSNQSFRVTWTAGSQLTFEGGGAKVICEVTIEGSFHSKTLSKVSGALVGYVTAAAFKHPCTENEMWALNGTEVLGGVVVRNTLPWHILYVSFSGVLPRITRIRLDFREVAFLVSVFGVGCLYQATTASPMFVETAVNETTGQATTLSPDPAGSIPLHEGGFLCPSSITLSGAGAVRLQGSTTTLIFVRLVQ